MPRGAGVRVGAISNDLLLSWRPYFRRAVRFHGPRPQFCVGTGQFPAKSHPGNNPFAFVRDCHGTMVDSRSDFPCLTCPRPSLDCDPRCTTPMPSLCAGQSGDRAALPRFVRRYQGALRRLAESRLGTVEAAEDVVQETFLRGVQIAPQL